MSNIKKCFVSRWSEGVIMEADFSQLEVIGLAVLSGDEQLKDDIKSGLDMHSVNAAKLFNQDFDEFKERVDAGDKDAVKKRKIAKALSFQLQYGAGAKSMAKSNGIAEDLAEKFIANYYDRYPEIKNWQTANIETVQHSSVPSNGKTTPKGNFVDEGQIVNPTGRLLKFYTNDAPDWMQRDGIRTTFSPTEIKNYPVQSFATGDIVPMVLGYVNDMVMWHEDEILLINTIHDSVMFDVKNMDYASYWSGKVKECMEKVPEYLKIHFELETDMQFPAEVEIGKTWADCK